MAIIATSTRSGVVAKEQEPGKDEEPRLWLGVDTQMPTDG